MPEYRRFRVPGAAVFFTVVTHQRRPIFASPDARDCLREAVRVVRARRPFGMPAIVLLPDHLHAIWEMPGGDSDYSVRWRRIKEEFSIRYREAGGDEGVRSDSRLDRGERGFWQRRFWEHTLFEPDDYERHVDYIHFNPVKHGLAACPHDWPFSTFSKWVERGDYPPGWGCTCGAHRNVASRLPPLERAVGE